MKSVISTITLLMLSVLCLAQNPIVTTAYTPDPAPFAHDGTLYMFTGHDEDDATYFKMKDWMLYSTEDMANWTYLGTPISSATARPTTLLAHSLNNLAQLVLLAKLV